jgi:dolichol-phosphate mannosyltransferase
METISIIIAVYNESENVQTLCRTLDEHGLDKPYHLELVFVDDGSVDDTLDQLLAYPFRHVTANVVKLSRNFGSHAAIRAGLSVATGAYSMLFSGDLQEPASLIDSLYEKIQDCYDIVYVEKGETRISTGEIFFSSLYARLIRRFAVSDFPSGGVNNFMMTTKVRERFVANPELNSSVFLQLMDMGFRHTFIVCDYLERVAGKSKWTLSKKIKAFIDSFVAFSFAPIRAVTTLGIALSFLGLLYALFIAVARILDLIPLATGFSTLISVVLIGFGLTNISLGILAEYLWRTLDASRNRPAFIIESVYCQEKESDA